MDSCHYNINISWGPFSPTIQGEHENNLLQRFVTLHDSSHGKKNTILYRSSGRNSFMYLSVFRPIIALYDFMNAVTPGHSYHQGCKIIRPRPQPRPYSFWLRPRFRPRSWHLASASWKLASWPRIFTVHMTLINIHNIAIDNHLRCSERQLIS